MARRQQSKRRARRLTAESDLLYYRTQIREACQNDHVMCLECGLTIHDRFDRLRKIGLSIPPASGLRPNANRKVSDEEIIALARSHLTVQEIAAKVGISKKNVHARLKALRTEP